MIAVHAVLAAMLAFSLGNELADNRAGVVPSGLGPALRVVWLPVDDTVADVHCVPEPPQRWTCEGLSASARGMVVFVGDKGIATLPIGIGDGSPSGAISAWGRLLRVMPGGVSPDDLRDLRASAWKVDRSNARLQTRRFLPIEDASIQIAKVSDTAFWITGSNDVEGYVEVDGPAVASIRLSDAALADGPVELPLMVEASMPYSLTGRVETSAGQHVEGAEVELFEPVDPAEGAGDARPPAEPALIRRARAESALDGSFTFSRLAPGRYQLAATHSTLGRATSRVERIAEPVVMRLTAPTRVSGRVTRRDLPVPEARIRFMPDAMAWIASTDPKALIAEDVSSGADGRFVLPLPPETTGVLQIVSPDGLSVRVPLPGNRGPGDISLGDVAIPDPRRLTIRLIDAVACDVSVVGPIGRMGLSIIHATPASSNVYWFELPEPGRWALNASCAGKDYVVEPLFVVVLAEGPDPTVDVHVVR